MPCACLSPCEVPSLVPDAMHSTAVQFSPIQVHRAAEIDAAEVLVFYAAAVLLLLPIVSYFQRRSTWCLLNLTGIRAAPTEPRRSRRFRLVLSERERRAVRRVSELARGVLGAAPLPSPLVHSLVPARSPNART